MIILKMVGSLKTSKLSCGKLDQAPKDSGRQGLTGSSCLGKSHLGKDASCKEEARRWERRLWGVKHGAGLGPNPGSGTDNPRALERHFWAVWWNCRVTLASPCVSCERGRFWDWQFEGPWRGISGQRGGTAGWPSPLRVSSVREAAGGLGLCPVPKARLPGFVSWLLLCCLWLWAVMSLAKPPLPCL